MIVAPDLVGGFVAVVVFVALRSPELLRLLVDKRLLTDNSKESREQSGRMTFLWMIGTACYFFSLAELNCVGFG